MHPAAKFPLLDSLGLLVFVLFGGMWDSRIVEGGIPLLVGVRCEGGGPYPAILLKSSLTYGS